MRHPFRVLAIETSCDDTAVAVVSSCRKILSQVIITQHREHQPYKGIVPKIAAQLHRENLPGAIRRCIAEAGLESVIDVDVVAATRGPGLASSLSAGFEAGRCLAAGGNLPFYPIHHMEGHALMARYNNPDIQFPFLALLISGGHTLLLVVRGARDYTILGTTMDDSVGEALDKATHMLKIPLLPNDSPAAALERAAAQCKGGGADLRLPLPMTGAKGLDFSFSGLKTALKYHLQNLDLDLDVDGLAYEFQRAACAHLEDRLVQAMNLLQNDIRHVVVSGGVARNSYIRTRLTSLVVQRGMDIRFAPFEYCSDNAVMIAWAAIENIEAGLAPSDYKDVRPVWPLDALKLEK